MKKLFGITTAMVTPFTKEGNVDLKAVKNLTNFLIDKGVNCLYPLGTTGEMFHIPFDQRKKVAETVVTEANGRCTVFIHCGAMMMDETIELCKHAESIHADGIGVVSPCYFGVTEREMENFYVTVAKSVSEKFPVYLYGIPQLAKNDISPKTAQRIAEQCPNVIGIKYSYPDMARTYDYLKINNSTFSVLQGADSLIVPSLSMGCDGVISGTSSCIPEPFVDLYKVYLSGDIAKARKMENISGAYCKILKNGGNMAYYKETLKLRGMEGGFMKLPQMDLQEEEIKELKNEFQKLPYRFW